MSKVPFKVSARTARLIGRENVANANGAVTELVKNTYDADALNCIIYFDNQYYSIPQHLSKNEYFELSKKSELITTSYHLNIDGNYNLNTDISTNELSDFFSSLCCIYIIDNGTGMNGNVIEDYWMTIGTDIKNREYNSHRGRVKTGAKGIGRFALDRLGKYCEMYTLPEGENDGYLWNVNWSDFEKPNLSINDISADLNKVQNLNLKSTIKSIANNYYPLSKLLEEMNFDSGTVLKISSLSDSWDEYEVNKIFESLEVLVPPKEMSDFKINLLSSLEKYEYGEVSPDFCDDFDYKISAKFLDDEDKTVVITIERNELDIASIEEHYSKVFNYDAMKKYPYDFETFKNKKFQIKKTLPKLLPGFKDVDKKRILDEIGEFTFSFYYLKNIITSKEKIYPYKSINSAIRKEWLRKFGGIKIFRDDFRIRPYGETGYDWLSLGNRLAQSPGSAGQSLSGYRVRPNQISGSIHISRITNESFQDKSGREGIQENDAFEVFKKIILGIIAVFENDRNNIMYHFKKMHDDDKASKKKMAEELAKKKMAEELAKKKEAEELTKNNEINESDQPSRADDETIADDDNDIYTLIDGFEAQKIELEEKDEEIRVSRSLSSSGLLIASFAHEFKTLHRHLKTRSTILRKNLSELLDPNELSYLDNYKNPFASINYIEKDDAKLLQWLNMSILTLKRDRRKRTNVNIKRYFDDFEVMWEGILAERSIKLLIPPESESCVIKAFPIDFDSMFSNLVANSIDAFKRDGASKERIILLKWKQTDGKLTISYSDTGSGLSSDYDDPTVIFNSFETTKRDIRGNVIGTGLGMWIVKNIVDDYSGEINILNPEIGFAVEIILPFRKECNSDLND